MIVEPEAKGVLLVADVPPGLANLDGPRTEPGASGTVGTGVFFLKPTSEAGRSVESISAMER